MPGLLRQGRGSKFRFILEERGGLTVSRMCRILGVSRSGYYAWLNREPSNRHKENLAALGPIREVYLEHRKAYGSPRVHAELRKRGFGWGRNRVARLMKLAGIRALRQYYYKRHTLALTG